MSGNKTFTSVCQRFDKDKRKEITNQSSSDVQINQKITKIKKKFNFGENIATTFEAGERSCNVHFEKKLSVSRQILEKMKSSQQLEIQDPICINKIKSCTTFFENEDYNDVEYQQNRKSMLLILVSLAVILMQIAVIYSFLLVKKTIWKTQL